MPGCAGRVAHARGGALVELRPVDDWRAQAEEILIREDAWRQRGLRHVADEHTLADGGECLPDGLEERPDTGTDEEHTVFRVVNNVGNVLTAPLTILSPRPHLALIKM